MGNGQGPALPCQKKKVKILTDTFLKYYYYFIQTVWKVYISSSHCPGSCVNWAPELLRQVVVLLYVAVSVFYPSVIAPKQHQPRWFSPSSPPFKHGSVLWRGRRFLRRATPLTPLRARTTWRGEAASSLRLARSFLPRVQWAPCGPTPSLLGAVYLFNVGFYSRRERHGGNNNSQKIAYSRRSPSTASLEEGSGLRDGNVPLPKHRVRFCGECKCTCSPEPVARVPTADFSRIHVRVSPCGRIFRPYVGSEQRVWQRGLLFHLQPAWTHFQGSSRPGHGFFSLNSGVFLWSALCKGFAGALSEIFFLFSKKVSVRSFGGSLVMWGADNTFEQQKR